MMSKVGAAMASDTTAALVLARAGRQASPVCSECARACAKAGSPLVILAENRDIYWPIADTTPSSGQNDKLLPFAGQKVTASGRVFQRGGSSALVIEKIEASPAEK